MTGDASAKLAVLIDADNASPAAVEGLLAEVAEYAPPTSSAPTATGPAPACADGRTT